MQRTVVIAEDELSIAHLLEEVLADEGYAVKLAADGAEALRLIEAVHPDLVVCDLMMPRMGGAEVWRRLKNNPDTAEVPFIFMSAAASRHEDFIDVPFLPKPFEIDHLLGLISRTLAHSA